MKRSLLLSLFVATTSFVAGGCAATSSADDVVAEDDDSLEQDATAAKDGSRFIVEGNLVRARQSPSGGFGADEVLGKGRFVIRVTSITSSWLTADVQVTLPGRGRSTYRALQLDSDQIEAYGVRVDFWSAVVDDRKIAVRIEQQPNWLADRIDPANRLQSAVVQFQEGDQGELVDYRFVAGGLPAAPR